MTGLPAGRIESLYRPPTQPIDPKPPDVVCEDCQGIGYFGRTGIFELLIVDDAIRQVLTTAPKMENLRAAARKVSLSPGAFSERIRRLEEELGAPLFHRTTRSARLTDAGIRLLPHARELLEQVRRCRDIVHEDQRPTPYELVIGTRYERPSMLFTDHRRSGARPRPALLPARDPGRRRSPRACRWW